MNRMVKKKQNMTLLSVCAPTVHMYTHCLVQLVFSGSIRSMHITQHESLRHTEDRHYILCLHLAHMIKSTPSLMDGVSVFPGCHTGMFSLL